MPTERLLAALASSGFTPARRDLAAIVGLLVATDDDGVVREIGRALARLPAESATAALAAMADAPPGGRARLARMVGQLLRETRDLAATSALAGALYDETVQVRRAAAAALGKIGGDPAAAHLAARAASEPRAEVRRAIAEALGRAGGAEAPVALAGLSADADDARTATVIAEASLRARRTLLRAEGSTLDPARKPTRAHDVVYHSRRGLEPWLLEELGSGAHQTGPGRVAVRRTSSLAELARPRIALGFGFALPRVRVRGDDPVDAARESLASRDAREVLASHAHAPFRFRVQWAVGGHRRGATRRLAVELAEQAPDIVNDPIASDWTATIGETTTGVQVELSPTGLADERFAYRAGDVYAASHPTIAAALVRAAGLRAHDVVWDPFVGSGLELCERARFGAYRHLYGSDVDARALEIARANLAAAGAAEPTLVCSDVRRYLPPEAVTLIVTNPPMGRRVLGPRDLPALYQTLLRAAARALSADGRLAWISPLPELTSRLARDAGFVPRVRRTVDMGGFDAELSVWHRG